MSLKYFYISFVFCALLFFSAPFDAHAQTPEKSESTAIDIVLAYHKLIGETPDFEEIFKKTARYNDAPNFAKKQILHQGVKNLKTYFKTINQKTVFIKKDEIQVDTIDLSSKTFSLDGVDQDTHFIFEHDNKNYALFMRNIDILKELPVIEPIKNYISRQKKYEEATEFTFSFIPLAADKDPLFIEKDKPLQMILVDIIGVNIKTYTGDRINDYALISAKRHHNHINKIVEELKLDDNF